MVLNGQLIILSGPSGVGKDTIIDAWAVRDPRVKRVVAYATRAPRPGEQDGLDYHFVSVQKFHELAGDGAFLEHKEVHGNFYATPLADLDSMLEQGLIAILKIDVQGALAAMELRPEALTVFISPPDMNELERRIRDRGSDDPAAIERRLANAREEMAVADRYHFHLVNDSVPHVVDQLVTLTQPIMNL